MTPTGRDTKRVFLNQVDNERSLPQRKQCVACFISLTKWTSTRQVSTTFFYDSEALQRRMYVMGRKLTYIYQYPIIIQALHGYVDAFASRDHARRRRRVDGSGRQATLF